MTNPRRRTPPAVYAEVCRRSGGEWVEGRCYGGHCEMAGLVNRHGIKIHCVHPNGDWRGLCFAHLIHRKLGGTTDPKVHSAENIRRSCYPDHDLYDGRVK